MADITNPLYVKFANERIRPTGDSAEQLYQTCKRFSQEWIAFGADAIPNDSSLFLDGSATDGRKPMSGALGLAVKSLSDSMIAWFETNATIGGVTKTRIQWLQTITTNGQSRF